MLGITIPKNVSRVFFIKTKGEWIISGEKFVFQKSSLLMTPCYDVTISGKECFIKLEWVVQLRQILSFLFK